jgi:pyruvate-ferredoxin/flavodoxin oxidoreductase
MTSFFGDKEQKKIPYPGVPAVLDGNDAVVEVEKHVLEGAGSYPITPSTGIAEGTAVAANNGFLNTAGRPIIFIEPEGEHAAAGVTIGLAMAGLRASTFTSAQGEAYMKEQLFVAVGKRLPLVIHLACRAMTKSTLNVHAGHDDYDDAANTGFIHLFARNNQEAADFALIARKIAELSLTPAIVGQDGFLTSHLLRDMRVPERALIKEYLGLSSDTIPTPTAGQKILYGETRRRVPVIMDVDNPVTIGVVTNQDMYMQSVAAQKPFFFDHIPQIAEQCMKEYGELTGRKYSRVGQYRTEDAEYILLAQGSIAEEAEIVADYLRDKKGLKVGVVNMTMFRPFPGDALSHVLKGKKGVTVLERLDQPMSEDLPLVKEIKSALSKALENGKATLAKTALPYPEYAVYTSINDMPAFYSASFGMGSRDTQPGHLIAAVENMMPQGKKLPFYYLGIEFVRDVPFNPHEEIYQQTILEGYPHLKNLTLPSSSNENLMSDDSTSLRMHSVGGWGAITTGKNLAMTLFELLGCHINANPKYGSEKKGAPTCFYLAASPEPVKMMCELNHLDVVMSPDPNVFKHSNPLAGLKKNGVFVIQSALSTSEEVWNTFPAAAQKYVKENNIRVFYVDGFKIAREESSDASLTFRMQGIAFQGAFFATSPVAEKNKLTKEQILKAIYEQIKKKFGKKGEKVVEDNFRVVKRGFTEVTEIVNK